MSLTRRAMLASVALAPGAAWAATPPATPPTLEMLVRRRSITDAAISPDGRAVALLRQQVVKDARVAFVELIDTADPEGKPKHVVIGQFEAAQVRWIKADKVLITLRVDREHDFQAGGEHLRFDAGTSFWRLFSLDLRTGAMTMMFNAERGLLRVNRNLASILDDLTNDPDHILMRAYDPQYRSYAIFKVNVGTGLAQRVENGGFDTYAWEFQDGVAVLRWDRVRRDEANLMARAAGEKEWKFVRKIRLGNEFFRPDFEIVASTNEPGIVLAKVLVPGEPTQTIRRFDIRTKAMGDVVSARPDLDVDGVSMNQGKVFAVRYTRDRTEYEFADPSMAPHFRGIDRFFGQEASVQIVDHDKDFQRLVLRADGPRFAGEYFWYDRKAARLEPLGQSRPWLAHESLAPVELLDVKTRDGSTIRAYLTRPLAQGPRPLLVVPHGGPEARDSLTFDLFAQAFAAQGWLVLQPNFRGSGGYGRAFADAGRRRWGDLMQEDVEDAIAQVIASGKADPSKIAIWGASYGGYAALMGAVRNPTLYKAAVSVAGVSDLREMLEFEHLLGEDHPVYEYWVRTLGDPKADIARLENSSPRYRAAEIKAPILLIHGVEDRVVPVQQSRLMSSALKAAGKPVQSIEIQDAGHNGWSQEVMVRVLQQSIDFLKPHLS